MFALQPEDGRAHTLSLTCTHVKEAGRASAKSSSLSRRRGDLQETRMSEDVDQRFFFSVSWSSHTALQSAGGVTVCLLFHSKPPERRPDNRQLRTTTTKQRRPFAVTACGQTLMGGRGTTAAGKHTRSSDRVRLQEVITQKHVVSFCGRIWHERFKICSDRNSNTACRKVTPDVSKAKSKEKSRALLSINDLCFVFKTLYCRCTGKETDI